MPRPKPQSASRINRRMPNGSGRGSRSFASNGDLLGLHFWLFGDGDRQHALIEGCAQLADVCAIREGKTPHERPVAPLVGVVAWLAMRGSGAVNAVSRRHAEVSRRLFQELFPRWPEREVPLGHVTNGVHVPSWDSAAADALWTRACGEERWHGTMEPVQEMRTCSDGALWAFRAQARAGLVAFVRERLADQLAGAGVTGDELAAADHVLDADVLTIGFARRFTPYKRPALLLRDPDRLARILTNKQRPVQLVLAGKAHPRDEEGKAFVQDWVRFVRRPDVRAHAVFLADYDLRLAERLVQGVDLWLNTPRPPWEACGTSGMKVLVNGGINLSSLDGWWAEAYEPEVGYALRDGGDDASDAVELYECLERAVIPAFYDRDAAGLPLAWTAKMRASMTRLTPAYSANRAMREYTDRYYVPGARAYTARAAAGGAAAASLVDWERRVRALWPAVRFGEIRVQTEGGSHRLTASVYLGEIAPEWVAVELCADAVGPYGAERVPMQRGAALVGARGFAYQAAVSDARPASHYTPRAMPAHPAASIPLELSLVAWPA